MAELARITVTKDKDSNKWEARVTFDGPFGKDSLEWPYYRPTKKSRVKVIQAAVKDVTEAGHDRIEVVTK